MAEKEFRLEQIFPVHIRDQIRMEEIWGALEEIRVRIGQPLRIYHRHGKQSIRRFPMGRAHGCAQQRRARRKRLTASQCVMLRSL